MKKKILVNFVDFEPSFNPNDNAILTDLRERYDVEVSEQPQYLIYSVFGLEHLKYDCIRIFYTGENVIPNFNECDYAFGFDRLSFGDRYRRIPIFLLWHFKDAYIELSQRKEMTLDDLHAKTGFCSFVVSNSFGQEKRREFFELLSQYKKVDSGGRYLNNIGGAVKDKKAFEQAHKFVIAFENQSYPGYTTEKLVDALAAHTIPIYYGDPDVTIDFNDEAFINCHRYKNFEEVVEVVKQIDQDDSLALKYLNANPFKQELNVNACKEYLYYIMDMPLEEARRRPVSVNVKQSEARLLRHQFFEDRIYKNIQRVKNQARRMTNGTLLTRKRKK